MVGDMAGNLNFVRAAAAGEAWSSAGKQGDDKVSRRGSIGADASWPPPGSIRVQGWLLTTSRDACCACASASALLDDSAKHAEELGNEERAERARVEAESETERLAG